MTLLFRLSDSSRTLDRWRRDRRSPCESAWAPAKRYARQHGAAGVWCADDSYRLFYMEAGKLRQRTWASARPID